MSTKWLIFVWSDYELLYSIESIKAEEKNTLREALNYAIAEWLPFAENIDIVRKRDMKTIIRFRDGKLCEEK